MTKHCNYLDFRLWKEARGYSVWSHKPHTCDKADCHGHFNSKREAMAELGVDTHVALGVRAAHFAYVIVCGLTDLRFTGPHGSLPSDEKDNREDEYDQFLHLKTISISAASAAWEGEAV